VLLARQTSLANGAEVPFGFSLIEEGKLFAVVEEQLEGRF
jgi:hypothetical protein